MTGQPRSLRPRRRSTPICCCLKTDTQICYTQEFWPVSSFESHKMCLELNSIRRQTGNKCKENRTGFNTRLEDTNCASGLFSRRTELFVQ